MTVSLDLECFEQAMRAGLVSIGRHGCLEQDISPVNESHLIVFVEEVETRIRWKKWVQPVATYDHSDTTCAGLHYFMASEGIYAL